MENPDPVVEELLLDGLEDYVGLWEVAHRVRHTLGLEQSCDTQL